MLATKHLKLLRRGVDVVAVKTPRLTRLWKWWLVDSAALAYADMFGSADTFASADSVEFADSFAMADMFVSADTFVSADMFETADMFAMVDSVASIEMFAMADTFVTVDTFAMVDMFASADIAAIVGGVGFVAFLADSPVRNLDCYGCFAKRCSVMPHRQFQALFQRRSSQTGCSRCCNSRYCCSHCHNSSGLIHQAVCRRIVFDRYSDRRCRRSRRLEFRFVQGC